MYDNTIAYYQSYQSLSVQNVKKMNLSKALQEEGAATEEQVLSGDVINEETYIFEPSTYEAAGSGAGAEPAARGVQ